MADYRLSVQVISRGQGKSVMAAAAYRAGVSLLDARTGLQHDYTRKQGVEYSVMASAKDAPDWTRDREEFWNRVEKVETRINSRTAREFQLSLPHELNFKQRRALVLDFVATEFAPKGLVADIALHKPSRKGDERNFHAHILVPTRPVTLEGFGPKNRDWNSRQQLESWRKSWAEIQNRHLEQLLGKEAPKVSHLSLADQNIDRAPQIHLGPHVSAMERRGIRTERGDQLRRVRSRVALDRSRAVVRDRRDALQYGVTNQTIDRLGIDLAKMAYGFTQQAEGLSSELKAVLDKKKTYKPITTKQVKAALLKPEKKEMARAKAEMDRLKEQAGLKVTHRTLLAWLQDPARQLFQKMARDINLDIAMIGYGAAKKRHDKLAYQINSPWGQAKITEIVDKAAGPAKELRARERKLRQKIAQANRWNRRATKTKEQIMTLRDAGVMLTIPMPKQVTDIRSFVRSAEIGTRRSYAALKPEIKQSLGTLLTRGLGLGIGR